MNIKINSVLGKLLFEYDCEGNNLSKTLMQAINEGADLRGADLRGANLIGANLPVFL